MNNLKDITHLYQYKRKQRYFVELLEAITLAALFALPFIIYFWRM